MSYLITLNTSVYSQPRRGAMANFTMTCYQSLDEALAKWKTLYADRENNGLKLINLTLEEEGLPLLHEFSPGVTNGYMKPNSAIICDYREVSAEYGV